MQIMWIALLAAANFWLLSALVHLRHRQGWISRWMEFAWKLWRCYGVPVCRILHRK